MDKTSLFNKIKEFGLNTREEYMAQAFSRNIGLLTQAEQDKLASAKVAIPGMGGVVREVNFSREGQVMLFRFGYGKEIKYGTYRKEPDSFLKLAHISTCSCSGDSR